MGLAITRKILALHGGSIAFESELNKGTCVSIKFPKIHIVGGTIMYFLISDELIDRRFELFI